LLKFTVSGRSKSKDRRFGLVFENTKRPRKTFLTQQIVSKIGGGKRVSFSLYKKNIFVIPVGRDINLQNGSFRHVFSRLATTTLSHFLLRSLYIVKNKDDVVDEFSSFSVFFYIIFECLHLLQAQYRNGNKAQRTLQRLLF
jgi:hypothetical protein